MHGETSDAEILLRRGRLTRAAALATVVGLLVSVFVPTAGDPLVEDARGEEPPAAEIPAGVAPARIAATQSMIREEIERGAFPGATLAIGRKSRLLHLEGAGRIRWDSLAPPADPDSTLYDLASVSKVMATATAVMLLAEDGKLSLDDPVQKYLPGFQGRWKEDVRIVHLLNHSSGLPQGTILRGETPAEVLRRLQRTLIYLPPGTRAEYSDIGYAILWAAAERAAGEPLPDYLRRRLYEPLGMRSTGFLPGQDCERCAPTLFLNRTREPFRGRPADETARRLGGVAGNAGLFSTARDVGRFAAMVANGGELDGVRVMSEENARLFTRMPQPGERPRAHGWQLFCPTDTLDEPPPCTEPYAFGHTGYAGTSLWIDPESGLWVVLLTNRTFLPRATARMPQLRRRIFETLAGR